MPAHAMVVLKHELMRLQIEPLIVLCVLSKRDRGVLVDNTPDLCDHPWRQLLVMLVPYDPDVFALCRLHEHGAVKDAFDSAYECDCLADKAHYVGDADEWVRLAVDVLDLFGHFGLVCFCGRKV